MEILKEVTQWDVDLKQPNHTYLLNNKGQIVAYSKFHTEEIFVLNSRISLVKKYRKFIKTDHSELSKLIPKYIDDDKKQKQTKNKDSRYFKVKSKEKEYIVEYNQKSKRLICSCVGFSYRGKCKHSESVAKKIQ
jgi:hypothetical protein